jgi:hypothetical protein
VYHTPNHAGDACCSSANLFCKAQGEEKNEEVAVVIIFWKPRSKGFFGAKHEVQWCVDSHCTSILLNLLLTADVCGGGDGCYRCYDPTLYQLYHALLKPKQSLQFPLAHLTCEMGVHAAKGGSKEQQDVDHEVTALAGDSGVFTLFM